MVGDYETGDFIEPGEFFAFGATVAFLPCNFKDLGGMVFNVIGVDALGKVARDLRQVLPKSFGKFLSIHEPPQSLCNSGVKSF